MTSAPLAWLGLGLVPLALGPYPWNRAAETPPGPQTVTITASEFALEAPDTVAEGRSLCGW
jgi:hypothetical protein